MAKKPKKPSETVTLTGKDKKTLGSIRDLATGVVQFAERGRPPYVDIPSRSLSNVKFNQSRRIIEMGRGSNRRDGSCRQHDDRRRRTAEHRRQCGSGHDHRVINGNLRGGKQAARRRSRHHPRIRRQGSRRRFAADPTNKWRDADRLGGSGDCCPLRFRQCHG